MHPSRRRKKQRPNNGRRIVDICRSNNGFGFTISGQQPCILSCIVPNSPADLVGLRAGHFLISINGLNVSKMPHEAIVQLINNSVGTIRLSIVENYYPDSSDEDNIWPQNSRTGSDNHGRTRRPKYPHHKLKINRANVQVTHFSTKCKPDDYDTSELIEKLMPSDVKSDDVARGQGETPESLPSSAHNIIHSPNASKEKDITNVSAMVPPIRNEVQAKIDDHDELVLEYRTVVGYLGTIEMPKQIATSSKLQTVRSCIRKMRQEKRQPSIVLMQILPKCLKLYNSENVLIAKYPANRLSYVSSNNANTFGAPGISENDMRFFGLVTSAVYADGQICEWPPSLSTTSNRSDVIISNSCHVFVIDLKLIDHVAHFQQAEQFSIVCTKDPITNCCLEFPSTSEYIVDLIRSMYGLNSNAAAASRALYGERSGRVNRNLMLDIANNRPQQFQGNNNGGGNSPQPSNHSEITTTSSNSDSGIGFHNDFTNISDRILVVEFPGSNNQNRYMVLPKINSRPVPFGVDPIRNIRSTVDLHPPQNEASPQIFHAKSKSLDSSVLTTDRNIEPAHPKMPTQTNPDLRLIRAMPDPLPFKTIINPSTTSSGDLSSSSTISPLKYERIFGGHCSSQLNEPIEERAIDVPLNPLKLSQSNEVLNCSKYSNDRISALSAARSCDDIMMTKRREKSTKYSHSQSQASLDDVSLLGDAPPPPSWLSHKKQLSTNTAEGEYVFLMPQKPLNKKVIKKRKKPTPASTKLPLPNFTQFEQLDEILSYKLSPKVFGVVKPTYASSENLKTSSRQYKAKENCDTSNFYSSKNDVNGWGSLQNLNDLDCNTENFHKRDFLESAHSEPDLMSRTVVQNSSPFRRWGQTSFRRSSEQHQANRLLQRRPSSLAASENDVYSKSGDNNSTHSLSRNSELVRSKQNKLTSRVNTFKEPISVSTWGTSFEKLLEDAAGLHTFAIFLKKEFSAENIYFWTACERYRQIDDATERAREADAIVSRHLATGAAEPVNVDSRARNLAQDNLSLADRDLFLPAQKQIFNLMKFDSYQRFIRSDLYKSCVIAEEKKQPLPYTADELDPDLRIFPHQSKSAHINSLTSKLKKSLSNAEDRRRKSLLPWHRKTRCKSKDRTEEYPNASNTGSLKKPSSTHQSSIKNSQNDIHSSRSSLSSFDAVISSRQNVNAGPGGSTNDSADESPTKSSLCRVILADGATTIVQTRHMESIRILIDRSLEKRGINYQSYEAFVTGSSKPIDLDAPSPVLSGKEVFIEQRVIFRLDLPNRKIISVKSKPSKALGEVLRPILQKYSYDLELVTVTLKNSSEPLSITNSVTTADGLRLQILLREDVSRSTTIRQQNNTVQQQNALEEITNRVFNELLQRRVDAHSPVILQQQQAQQQQQKRLSDAEDTGMRSDDLCSESSLNNFSQLRHPVPKGRTFVAANKHRKYSVLPSGTSGAILANSNAIDSRSLSGTQDNCVASDDGNKKPLIAKWKAGVKVQNAMSPSATAQIEGHDLLEGLKRAQRSRLEDQRGTEINAELPDFLKDNGRSKLRKVKAASPATKYTSNESSTISDESIKKPLRKAPQPAPRLSINKSLSSQIHINDNDSQRNCDENANSIINGETDDIKSDKNLSNTSSLSSNHNSNSVIYANGDSFHNDSILDSSKTSICSGTPPPLPPKPKIKPSNWCNSGRNGSMERNKNIPLKQQSNGLNASSLVSGIDGKIPPPRTVYLDQPNSSFV